MHRTTSKSNNKIVWFFNQNANSPDLPGGTRHFDFSKELNESGFDCTVFTSNFHGFERRKIRGVHGSFRKENVENVKFVWIKSLSYKKNGLLRILNMFMFSFKVYRVARRREFKKPDIVVGSSPHLLTALSAYMVSKYYKVPFIFEVRDIWPLTLIDLGHPKYHPFIIGLSIVERFLYKRASKIIMLMQDGDKYLKTINIGTDKLVWVSNGVSLKSVPTNKTISNLDKSYFNVTYAGTIGEANDIETIVQAAQLLKKYKRIKINIYVDGVRRLALIEKKNNLKLENISFNCPVPKKEIFTILKDSDALLFTLKEASVFRFGNPPNKIFDYLASAKPIIFSSNASNNLIKQSNSGISVTPESPAKLARAIRRMSNLSETQRKQMGKNGYKFVSKNYTVETLARKYRSVIEGVINSG